MGQAPDRQAMLGAGIPKSVPCTLVNKARRALEKNWPRRDSLKKKDRNSCIAFAIRKAFDTEIKEKEKRAYKKIITPS